MAQNSIIGFIRGTESTIAHSFIDEQCSQNMTCITPRKTIIK